jgi:SpoVK/Ycf46/Vps4 family AAA+-type ATPase
VQAGRQLDAMVGLPLVKDKMDQLLATAANDAAKRARGLQVPERTMHLVFEGPPGTGKTTAAQILANAYYGAGLVDNPDPIIIRGRELVAGYEGQTDAKVKEIFDRAKGKVLFIDEFYSIVSGDQDNVGREALNAFNDLAEKRRNDTVVILAGYEDEQGGLKYLDRYNPGISSRFPTRVPFTSYTPRELAQIAHADINRTGKAHNKNAARALSTYAGMVKDNARGVRNLVDAVHRQSDLRRKKTLDTGRTLTDTDLVSYTATDVRRAAKELGYL